MGKDILSNVNMPFDASGKKGVASAGGPLSFTVNNSAILSQFIIGTAAAVTTPLGSVAVRIEDTDGTRIIELDRFDSTGHPPWRVIYCTLDSGDDWDTRVLANFGSGTCLGLIDGRGIWTTSAGIPRTVSNTFTIQVRVSSSGTKEFCPGSTIIFEKTYEVTVTFSG